MARLTDVKMLTDRWEPLREHKTQWAAWTYMGRYSVLPSGRRSGKSEIIGKRKMVMRALMSHERNTPFFRPYNDPRFGIGAPTRDQAKRIYWNDIKRMIPKKFLFCPPNESQLIVSLLNGAEIHVLGMDKPERVEGSPWDHFVLDEYGNMKEQTWGEHVRPALSDRQGGCDFIGVPEGRNHYYELSKMAKAEQMRGNPDWALFHWLSSDILLPSEIEAAKREMDELTFKQEYEGCHLPSTLISFWCGDIKPISEVKPGDIVTTFQKGKVQPTEVLKVEKTGVKGLLSVEIESGLVFTASKYHKMRVKGEKTPLVECKNLDFVYNQWEPQSKKEVLAGILGFTLGDGSVSRRPSGKLACSWYLHKKEDLEIFKKDLFKVWPECRGEGGYKNNGYQISLGNPIASYLVEKGCPVGRRSLQDIGIPEWIKESSWNVKRAFLAGIFGADSSTPVPAKSGKNPKPVILAMVNKRLVEEAAQILKDQGYHATVTYSSSMTRLYVDRAFLRDVGFLYNYDKAEKAWLWTHYLSCVDCEKRVIAGLRAQGKKWKEIGDIVGLKMHSAYQLGHSKAKRASSRFPKFKDWVKDKYNEGSLSLKIIAKKEKPEAECWNLTVDSSDHSYVLANEIDNFNSFINFTGRAYYNFIEETHCAKLEYRPNYPLIFCFDFNVEPGVAVVCQEQSLPNGQVGTGIIGEVHVPRNSNTVIVTRKLCNDWAEHKGGIFVYGDASGAARGSSKIKGSDWQLVKEVMWSHFSREQVHFRISSRNPPERARVNSVNSRCMSVDGTKRLMLDPVRAPHTLIDFEGVTVVKGGSGEIDKKGNPKLTHLSDALGYYIFKEYPVKKKYVDTGPKFWK